MPKRKLPFTPLVLASFIVTALLAACGGDGDNGSISDPDLRIGDVDEFLTVICEQAATCPDISPTPEEIDSCPVGIRSQLSDAQVGEVEQFTTYGKSRQDCVLECIAGVICGRFGVALSAISDADAIEPLVDCGWECQ